MVRKVPSKEPIIIGRQLLISNDLAASLTMLEVEALEIDRIASERVVDRADQ